MDNKLRIAEKFFIGLIFFFILLAVIAVPISFLPHYEKKVYRNTIPLTKEDVEASLTESETQKDLKAPYGVTGYPSTGISTKITGIEDLQSNLQEAICLETDVKNLKATGFYERMKRYSSAGASSNFSWKSNVSKGNVIHSSYDTPLHTRNPLVVLWNRSKAVYAQYYVLTLEDGSKVFLLLNDTAVPVPRTGSVKLPLASWKWLNLEYGMSEEAFANEHGVGLIDNKDVHYLDAATSWGMFYPGVKEAHRQQAKQAVVLVIIGIAGAIVSIIVLYMIVKHDKSLN